MANSKVSVTSIVVFCVVAIGAGLIIRNLNGLFMIASKLWSVLPPNDVLMRYAATGVIALFAIYVINYTVIQRKPINLETAIKDNKYIEINPYTASSFCIAAVISIIYCIYINDNGANGDSGIKTFAEAAASAKRSVDPMQFAIFAFILYGLVQIYYMMLWGITNTSVFKA